LPAFAKIQDDNNELAEAYRNLIDYIARFVFPVSGCAVIAAPELLSTIYGSRWLPAAMPMRILVSGLALAGVRIAVGTVFYAKKYPSIDIYLSGGRLTALVVIILLTAQHGLSAVSVGVSIVEGLISIVAQYLVCSLVGLRLRAVMSAMLPGTRIAAASMLATTAGKMVGTWLCAKPPFVLGMAVGPAAIVFLWLQAGDAARMIRTALKTTPDKAA
jgi:PST family polysaccharide transporter